MTTIKPKCPNCGAYKWKYYEKYKGHGCGNCGFLYLDNEYSVVVLNPLKLSRVIVECER